MNTAVPVSTVGHRLFFALWPDAATRARIAAVHDGFSDCMARWTVPDKLHVTLVFLGSVEPARMAGIVDAASHVHGAAFHLRLDWAMPIVRSGMLWLTPRTVPDELGALVAEMQRRLEPLGFAPEARRFRPHVTLARKMKGTPRCRAVEPIDWPVDAFALVESIVDGGTSRYVVRNTWPLAPAAVGG